VSPLAVGLQVELAGLPERRPCPGAQLKDRKRAA